MKLDIDRDDDPHLRQLDGADVDYYEQFGETCYLVNVERDEDGNDAGAVQTVAKPGSGGGFEEVTGGD